MAKECPWDRDPGTVTPGLGWALHLPRRVGGFGVERETASHQNPQQMQGHGLEDAS